MNTKTLLVRFLMPFIFLGACALGVPESTESVPDISAVEPNTSTESVALTATFSVPTSTAEARGPGYHPLSTRTAIPDVDAVLAAVESGDPQALRNLVRFTTVACTKAEGLGGPPKCRENEAEGTLVQVLPILGPEGHHMNEAELAGFPGLSVLGLYAVYRVSDTAYSEEAYPAGEYAVMFRAEENKPHVVVQIRGGIVRLDFIHPPTSLDEIIQRDASELVIAPE